MNDYLTKRNRQRLVEELDPLGATVNKLFDGILRTEAKIVARSSLQGIVFSSLIEAQFLKFFNNTLIKTQVRRVAKEAIAETILRDEVAFINEKIIRE